VDLAYLREHPRQLQTFLTHQRIRETPVEGGSICAASRLTFDSGESVFMKEWPAATPPPSPGHTGPAGGGGGRGDKTGGQSAPEGFFEAEANGLRWLAEGGADVPEVILAEPNRLVLSWIEHGEPSAKAAEHFGRTLATAHRSGAAGFGASWAGFHGSAPMDNTLSQEPWHVWYAERRLTRYLKMSIDRHALDLGDIAAVERVINSLTGDADEPPSRIHGDLWTGNLIWGADDRCWLVDPAAHGGHRETDLAYLRLWGGVAHFDRIAAAYQEQWPLLDGWPERVPLHQLSMYLLHTALFGAAFAPGVRAAAAACR
jgi:fructosamine-3-kinase